MVVKAGKASQSKQTSLLDPSVGYEENGVWPARTNALAYWIHVRVMKKIP